jgi:uncharacterized protein YgiM (DUF1202 family)
MLDRISDLLMPPWKSRGVTAAPQPAEEASQQTASAKSGKSKPRSSKPSGSLQEKLVQPPYTVESLQSQGVVVRTETYRANVKSDSAAVYSSNSARSPIVGMLRKGDRVETTLEIIDSEGRWVLIRTADLRSGFVRNENLERAPMSASRD